MSRLTSALGAFLLGAFLLTATPTAAQAQPYEPPTNNLEFSVFAGGELPTMDLMDAADPGPAFGVIVAPRLHEQVTLNFNGNAALLSGDTYPFDVEGPSMQLYRFTAGVEVNVFDPKLTKWRLLFNGGVGWSFLTTGDLPQQAGTTEGVSSDGFTTKVGAKAAYPISEGTYLFFGSDAYFHDISGGEDLQPLQNLNRAELGDWDPAWSFTPTIGVRFSLN